MPDKQGYVIHQPGSGYVYISGYPGMPRPDEAAWRFTQDLRWATRFVTCEAAMDKRPLSASGKPIGLVVPYRTCT
jgi:hypothetical protein